MSRRRRNQPTITLFPFLSVLACVIGTLTLLIAGMAVGQLAVDTAIDWVAYEQVQEELAAGSSQMEELEGKIAGARAALASLDGIREVERVNTRIGALEKEREGLLAAILETNALLEKLTGEQDRKDETIVIQPSGSGRQLRPFFVECTRNAIVVHRPGRSHRLPVRGGLIDRQFRTFLRRVRVERDSTVIFLIRPQGVENFERASSMAEHEGVRHGYLPLPGPGRLDLEKFEGT